MWDWLDTQSKLEVVAARKDSWLQGGLDFGTFEILYLLYVLHLGEEDHTNYESISWYLRNLKPPLMMQFGKWLVFCLSIGKTQSLVMFDTRRSNMHFHAPPPVRPPCGEPLDVRLHHHETGTGPDFLFGRRVSFLFSYFRNMYFLIWDSLQFYYFRGLERHEHERSRIEPRTFGSKCHQSLTCRSPSLPSLSNDGSVKR